MTNPDATPERQDQLMREAAAWFARMRGPEAEESRAAFEAWLRRGALHRSAYNRAAEIFAMGKILAEDEAAKPVTARTPRLRTAAFAAILLLLAALVPLLTFGSEGLFHPSPKEDANGALASSLLETAPAETRTFALADGSRISLGPDSRVKAELGHFERRLELMRGGARFEVFREERPFVVHAGGGIVTARGTVFDVAVGGERRVTIRLLEGSVDVKLPASRGSRTGQRPSRRLRPGGVLSFASGEEGIVETSHSSRGATQARSAVTREYEAVAIAQLVEEANLVSRVPIRLEDRTIGVRRVSGRFRIDDGSLLAQRLAILFDLSVDRSDPRIVVLRPR